ncbi:DEAD/DEAH box helicase [Marinicella sp. S1101]|uniref:DEAD/DEAH box helicase n=1 Tax=Marinicella marina TaxID=2996016 RepID=UPI002260B3B1|nr:DEAD/DEAH box helicase [Marinicella marina]MCX7552697.1 DEAD/DEAH box helicase [Marinicella marina]MDJ1139573.1 DEAD/DEAH box helicase [Marinicella marina]
MFNPVITQWFTQVFKQPTPVQQQAWQEIASGKDVLIAAPTGSGKTLAAFLSAINQLFEARADQATGLKVIYVSPLKALSNDININLQQPLLAINQLDHEIQINSAVWTGDTPSYQRDKIKRQPPHILVTTPESLYNILTSAAGRSMLASVESVIIDEVHALAPNKRGAHLLLSLMRLEALTLRRPQRIAISATQRPIEKMQSYVLHQDNSSVVDLGHKRDMELRIEIPPTALSAVMSNEQMAEVYELLSEQIKGHQTTVVFVNNRRLAERAAKHLAERVGEDAVTAHHGSLAKEHRLKAEQALKAGQLKAIVATASLELGIDIGDVDLVCQLGSPGSIQALLQRVGRSGHGVNRTPKGLIYPLTIDDLLETSAALMGVESGVLEETEFPQQPLDVLAQQIVAEVSQKNWQAKQLYHLFSGASIYQGLTFAEFEQVVSMLAAGYSGRSTYQKALVFYDELTGEIRPRKAAALTALLNGGTIPEQFDYDVRLLPDDLQIGTLNEDFSFESVAGDIFQLGNHSYRILQVKTGTVYVEDAAGQPPNIPFWFGVQMWRSDALSRCVSQLRQDFNNHLIEGQTLPQLAVNEFGVAQLINYCCKTKEVLGTIPSQQDVVVERFFDGNNDMHLVIHSVFGSRVNRAWGLALRKKFCRQFNFELQAAALEDALILSLSSTHSFELSTIQAYLKPDTVKEVLIQALLDTPFFVTQWRWNASVALAVKRRRGGKKVIPQFQRNEAEDLVAEIFPDQIACAENIAGARSVPDHPLVAQTITDCTEGIMDVKQLASILAGIDAKAINIHYIDSHTPSPTSLAIINARNYAFLDEAPAEERRTLAVQSQRLDESFTAQKLNDFDIQAFNQSIKPLVRDLDELHEWISYHGLLWTDEVGPHQLGIEQLLSAGRIHEVQYETKTAYCTLHAAALVQRVICEPQCIELEDIESWVNNRLSQSGLIGFKQLHQRIPLAASFLQQALMSLEHKGVAFRFDHVQDDDEYWIERHQLARLRKRQLSQQRRAVKTLSADAYQDFLHDWQFLSAPAEGIEGLSQVLKQWQGFATSSHDWEAEVIKPRVNDYHGMMLDMLCQTGQFIWKRAKEKFVSGDLNQMTIQKTQFTFLENKYAHLFPAQVDIEHLNAKANQVVHLLADQGALFFREILTHKQWLPLELEQVLIQLIKQGLLVADGFQALRVFAQSPADRRRQLIKAKKHGNSLGYLEMMGRWSLIEQKPVDNSHYITLMANRYGVLSYDVWQNEQMPVKWREASRLLQRMEARGEILAGRFIERHSGMQYALPHAYDKFQHLQDVK